MLKIPQTLQAESLHGFILAICVPIVTATAGLRGILEALQRFRIANLIRIPLSIFSFVAPLMVLPFSHSLFPVIAVLVLGRLIGCGIHVWACLGAVPQLRKTPAVDRMLVIPLLRYGSWMTANNVLGPLMSYMDRFLIGILLSVTAVAYYTAPVDMVLRLTVIPLAVVGVLFPAFAMSLSQDPIRAGLLLSRGLKYVFLVVFPIVLVIVTLAPEGLRLWLGPTFSLNGAAVLRWVAAGAFVNALSTLPFVLIQSAGRPDITAWLLVAELPLYCGALWALTRRLGIQGTAIAWAGRLGVEAVVVFFLVPAGSSPEVEVLVQARNGNVRWLGGSKIRRASSRFCPEAGFSFVALGTFGIAGWFWGLQPNERNYLILDRNRATVRVEPK